MDGAPAGHDSATSLLDLPHPCLQAVLQCRAVNFYTDGNRALCSAARAHSRLHQAAVAALHSIAKYAPKQRDALRVMLYLEKHGQHVSHLHMNGNDRFTGSIRRLPTNLHLSSLQLDWMCLQLFPRSGLKHRFPGVLGSAGVAGLRRLRFSECELIDDAAGLAAALSKVAGTLEHLMISNTYFDRSMQPFPTAVLRQLQKLTYLELVAFKNHGGPSLQSLQALTALVELRLGKWEQISASSVSHKPFLTQLSVSSCSFELGGLAGNTQLQQLILDYCSLLGPAAGGAVEQLMYHLQPLQQLTLLSTVGSLTTTRQGLFVVQEDAGNPAAAYAALSASSKLRLLDIGMCILPAGVWQYMFPTGRQLPHLTCIHMCRVMEPSGSYAPAPEGSRLVSCCPGLAWLDMQMLSYGTELISVRELTGLTTLSLAAWPHLIADCLRDVAQLTRLRELHLNCDSNAVQGVVQLSQLKRLVHHGRLGGALKERRMTCKVSS